jgi:hypothetical protein
MDKLAMFLVETKLSVQTYENFNMGHKVLIQWGAPLPPQLCKSLTPPLLSASSERPLNHYHVS